jgi:hypothetical protein
MSPYQRTWSGPIAIATGSKFGYVNNDSPTVLETEG